MEDTVLTRMVQALENAGYREIDIQSYDALVGGCRYVFIETRGPSEFTLVHQFVPNNFINSWKLFEWEAGSYIYRGMRRRSELSSAMPPVSFVSLLKGKWFGRPVIRTDCNMTCKMVEYTGLGFDLFVEDHSPKIDNPEDWPSHFHAFNVRHPISQAARVERDLRIIKQQLKAREDALKLKEVFSEADELRQIGSQFAARGQGRQANAYYRAADDLRRRIQNKLDNGLPVTRENVQVEEMPEIIQYQPTAAKKKEVQSLSISTGNKRSIILE